jgi:predicted TIM-barrel fold metal-dependent hydrolase
MGTLPLQVPEMAVAELEWVVKELGFRGVEINTNLAGEDLSSRRPSLSGSSYYAPDPVHRREAVTT